MNDTPPKENRLLRLCDVEKRTGLKRSSIYEKIARPVEQGGGFPRPIKLGRISVWDESEVQAWVNRVIAEAA